MCRMVGILALILAPVAALAQEPVAPADDSAMQLAPRERLHANSPSAEHVAFMDALTGENLAAETERQNQLEDARRVAPVDLRWGLP